MKIRNGFVSNSSSSSFVVEIRPLKFEPTGRIKSPKLPKGFSYRKMGMKPPKLPELVQVSTPLLVTKKQMKALEKRGFKFCHHTYASRVEEGAEREDKKLKPELATHMYRSVVCNEADEVEFLVKHNIPFEGSTHYGHYSVFFWKDSDTVVTVRNVGREIETYKSTIGKAEQVAKREPIVHKQCRESILREGWAK